MKVEYKNVTEIRNIVHIINNKRKRNYNFCMGSPKSLSVMKILICVPLGMA